MDNFTSTSDNLIKTRLAEADLYYSQGLNEEARLICLELLKLTGDKSHPLYPELESRLKKLQVDGMETIQSGKTDSTTGKDLKPEDIKEYQDNKFNSCIGLMDAGFYSEAIEELKTLLEDEYRPGIIRAKIGESYLRLDTPFEALEYLQEALEDTQLSKDERLDVLYQLALTHERTGAVPKAIEALEQIIRLDPAFRNAKQRLEELSQTVQKYGRFYYLIRNQFLSEEQLNRTKELAKQGKKSIESILLSQFGLDKTELGRSLSEYYRCPFVEFDELEVGTIPSCVRGIKEHFFRTNSCAPINEQSGTLTVALDNPHDLAKIDNIRRVLKAKNFEFAVSLKEDINRFIDYFYGKYSIGGSDEDVFEQLEVVDEDTEVEEEDDGLASNADSVVVQITNKTIEDAYQRRASDIHIESLAGKRGTLVRFRIDGDCMRYQTIPYNYKRAMISRIKIMSNLDIAEKRLPQDGKIKFRTRSGKILELRVATLPTTEGNEDIVLRLLASSEAMPIDRIGLLDQNMEQLKQLLQLPYGLILVVGPTGSGKTTTLHAALGYINRPDRKIWTAEDPVEIMQDGLRQVQVRPGIGLTFARILRAFLRADPDVIMIGETRDEETATTAIEASLTGHLVFSTLHTNSAPETVTRLLGMGMDPFNFADALLGVLAQRLVKRLCPKCREAYEPDDNEKKYILHEYGFHPTQPLELSDLNEITLYRPKGCQNCNKTGFRGRLAIYELLMSDDGLKKLIQEKRPVAEIREHAMNQGMLTLKQDGIQKVLRGDTDLKQIKAACIR
ncbi:MAG: type II/IV secretion system protein [Thermodesulfobacteriota bacterium]|nr:MAG: type II/IV secretion system protein [Thermodesulfobacteriota bacterium]